jgi:prohibitin 2
MKKLTSILFAGLFLTGCGFEIVDTGHRGIETRYGAVVGEPLTEGLHFYNPVTSNIIEMNVQQSKWESETNVRTKDNQSITLKFAEVYNLEPTHAHSVFREYGGLDWANKIVAPAVLGTIKDAIGQFAADDFNSSRERVRELALDKAKDEVSGKGVTVVDIYFTDVDFNDQYEHAVEQKVVAQQQALTAKNETAKIQEQAKQQVMTAQAAAEAMRIKSQALSQNKALVEYEMVQKWDGALPQYMFGNATPMIDMSKLTRKE